jgi:hypothetical protein
MSAAAQPSEVLETPCGRVKVSPPSSTGGYWRLEWYEHGQRKQTSGGRTQETATARVAEVLERLDRKLAPKSTRRVQEAREAYEVCDAQLRGPDGV